jgi:hypothetical protein
MVYTKPTTSALQIINIFSDLKAALGGSSTPTVAFNRPIVCGCYDHPNPDYGNGIALRNSALL